MKTIRNTLLAGTALFLMILGDAPPDARFGFQLVSDAHAVLGVWRRHARRAVVVGSAAATATVAAEQSATAQQQAATAQQQSATAQQQAATAQQQSAAAQQQTAAPPPAAAANGEPLPIGTVVSSLPSGCTSKPVGGVEYYHCGSNYYRAVFQGNSLVYVTAKP